MQFAQRQSWGWQIHEVLQLAAVGVVANQRATPVAYLFFWETNSRNKPFCQKPLLPCDAFGLSAFLKPEGSGRLYSKKGKHGNARRIIDKEISLFGRVLGTFPKQTGGMPGKGPRAVLKDTPLLRKLNPQAEKRNATAPGAGEVLV